MLYPLVRKPQLPRLYHKGLISASVFAKIFMISNYPLFEAQRDINMSLPWHMAWISPLPLPLVARVCKLINMFFSILLYIQNNSLALYLK